MGKGLKVPGIRSPPALGNHEADKKKTAYYKSSEI